MPLYTSLNTQIEAIKSEITASLNASTYTAQDLVYVAKAIETLGNLLGINDLAAASTDAQNTLSTYVNSVIAGTAAANALKMYIGTGAQAFETSAALTNAIATFRYADGLTSNSFAQIAFTNADASSSTDIQMFMNNGNDDQGWIDMGITGSTFADPSYPITYAGDGYLFVKGKPSYRGNLVIGTGSTGTQNKIIFAANGYDTGATQMTITPGVSVNVAIATSSTSTTTGALTVAGGLGVVGNVNIGGNVNIAGTIAFGGGGTTVETANIAVVDPMIYVSKNNPADLLDGALVVEYYSASATKYSSFFRDASDAGIWKFVSNITSKPTTTINTSQAALAYDVVYAQAFRTSRAATANDEVTQKLYVDNQDQDNFVSVLMGVLA
jgi:hypothetical protein